MPCFKPLKGWRSKDTNPSGKRSIVFDATKGNDESVTLPCGNCIGCRLERSRQWAIRCVHEASLYEKNCFVTLTYQTSQLPPGNTLDHRHVQLFMKRLRRRFGSNIRYFMCGEYGERFQRPHYHLCLFNFDLKDKKLFKTSNGNSIYTSQALSELWVDERGESRGFSTVGALTFESAAYVARYVTKKINGLPATEHYHGRKPEYCVPSRRPGIGRPWIEKYHGDVFNSDFVVLRNKKMRAPKFYDRWFSLAFPERFEDIQFTRYQGSRRLLSDNTEERLFVKEFCQWAKFKQLPRSYEHESEDLRSV